jgi:SpoVK/Ycf46/Vps4 family AAA+-type ATPase
MQIISSEKEKKHNILASDLMKILENGTSRAANTVRYHELDKLPRDGERGALLVEVRSPEKYIDEIILSSELEEQLERILEENRSASVLRTYGLNPISKILFAGPPGCGKTLCAEVLATELGLPLLYIRFDAVISSYLGETASNLRKVFDYASSGKWVVFFDEFDAIAKSRSDREEHGELKRVVNTYLQLLDGLQARFPVIAATNHEELLDRALWRRFDDILYFDRPDKDQIIELIHLKLRFFRHEDMDFSDYASNMIGWSHSDIERVCLDAIKKCLLNGEDVLRPSHLKHSLQINNQRRTNILRSNKPQGG